MRQPECQGHERAKNEKIVQGKPPDPQFPQRLHLLHEGLCLFARALGGHRVFLGQHDENNTHDRQHRGVDLGSAFPAECDQQEWRSEIGHRRPNVPCTKNPQRRSLPCRLKPGRCVGNAHDECATGQANAESPYQKHDVGGCESQQVNAGSGGEHQYAKDPATTVPVCPDAQEESADGAGENGGRHQKAQLGIR